jgi:hypothetical protein
MTHLDDADPAAPHTAEPVEALSRRQALSMAGLVAAGASAVAAREASAHGESDPGGNTVGEAEAPANAVEFRARFVQTGASGEDFAAYGYLTRAAGTNVADLFWGGSPLNETTALLTAYASGTLARRVLDQSVHSLDIEGTLTIYQRAAPGASFATPASFQVGEPVARFDLTLQDILTVFAPAKGIPTLTGGMSQTLAGKLAGTPAGRRFGHRGSRARLFATGLGTLVDPVTLNAALEMAGNWVLE